MNEETVIIVIAGVLLIAALAWIIIGWTRRIREVKDARAAHAEQRTAAAAAPAPTAAPTPIHVTSDGTPLFPDDAWLFDHHRVQWSSDPATFQPTPEHWAVAVPAPFALCFGTPWDVVRYNDPDSAREVLAGAWGVNSRAGLIRQLMSLLFTGHRWSFEQEVRDWSTLSPAAAAAEETELREDAVHGGDAAERLWRFRRVQANDRGIRTIDFAAWDLIRAGMLARAGAAAGYFSDAEAADFLAMIAPEIRARYGSWQDLGTQFHTGRWYWNSEGGEGERKLLAHDATRQDALLSANGPWARIPWDLPLPATRHLFVDVLWDEGLVVPIPEDQRFRVGVWQQRVDDVLRQRHPEAYA